jgi:VWFA-related protein
MANCRIKAPLLFATGILLAQSSRDLVVHVEVNLVQVDAIVTDAKGKPVTDLATADFEILQDGKPQTITNFSYIDTTAGAVVTARVPRIKGAPPLPAVDLQPADVRRTFVVVVDDLGVAWENLPAIKHALRKFVEEEKQPTDLVAILATGGGMGIFQQFTTDPKQLLAAVDHLKFNLIFNRVGVSSFPSLGPMRMPANPIKGYVSRQQTALSIGSILRALRDMPGRKIMLLFSEEMSMVQGDDYVQYLGDQAVRASVAIYAVDPRRRRYRGHDTAADFAGSHEPFGVLFLFSGRAQLPGAADGRPVLSGRQRHRWRRRQSCRRILRLLLARLSTGCEYVPRGIPAAGVSQACCAGETQGAPRALPGRFFKSAGTASRPIAHSAGVEDAPGTD